MQAKWEHLIRKWRMTKWEECINFTAEMYGEPRAYVHLFPIYIYYHLCSHKYIIFSLKIGLLTSNRYYISRLADHLQSNCAHIRNSAIFNNQIIFVNLVQPSVVKSWCIEGVRPHIVSLICRHLCSDKCLRRTHYRTVKLNYACGKSSHLF